MMLSTMTHGLSTLIEARPSDHFLVAERQTENQSEASEEQDDGVEPLIVHMDRTTAEHLFLQAQRHMQREAAAQADENR